MIGTGALEDKLANLTVEQREALDKDLAKREKKEEQKAEKEKAKIAVRPLCQRDCRPAALSCRMLAVACRRRRVQL